MDLTHWHNHHSRSVSGVFRSLKSRRGQESFHILAVKGTPLFQSLQHSTQPPLDLFQTRFEDACSHLRFTLRSAMASRVMPPASSDLHTTWAFLVEGIDHIMTKLHTGVTFSKVNQP